MADNDLENGIPEEPETLIDSKLSILLSTKKTLGIEPDYEHFDTELILHINSVFFILLQLGVGPEEGFMIENAEAQWTDFFGDRKDLNAVKTYVYLRVRLLFDPPQMGYLVEAIKKQVDELEWRLNVQVDPKKSEFTALENAVQEGGTTGELNQY